MFGKKMKVENVLLKPFTEEQIITSVEAMSDHRVTRYTMRLHSPTKEDQLKWLDSVRKSEDKYAWGVFLEETPEILRGSTSLKLRGRNGHSGIIIFDQSVWGQGVASRAHIARTYFAADQLDLLKIGSRVLEPNVASRKALEKVGYVVTGKDYGNYFVDGEHISDLILNWINPKYVKLLFPKSTPLVLPPGIEKARETLVKAKEIVEI